MEVTRSDLRPLKTLRTDLRQEVVLRKALRLEKAVKAPNAMVTMSIALHGLRNSIAKRTWLHDGKVQEVMQGVQRYWRSIARSDEQCIDKHVFRFDIFVYKIFRFGLYTVFVDL